MHTLVVLGSHLRGAAPAAFRRALDQLTHTTEGAPATPGHLSTLYQAYDLAVAGMVPEEAAVLFSLAPFRGGSELPVDLIALAARANGLSEFLAIALLEGVARKTGMLPKLSQVRACACRGCLKLAPLFPPGHAVGVKHFCWGVIIIAQDVFIGLVIPTVACHSSHDWLEIRTAAGHL